MVLVAFVAKPLPGSEATVDYMVLAAFAAKPLPGSEAVVDFVLIRSLLLLQPSLCLKVRLQLTLF